MGETIGFDFNNRSARILATLYLHNECENDQSNYIELLHPGNVRGELMYSSPLPLHPKEPESAADKAIIEQVYGKAFKIEKDDGGAVRSIQQVYALSPWDTWYPMDQPDEVDWPGNPDNSIKPRLEQIFSEQSGDHFEPFTVWEIGPFRKHGAVIFSVDILIEGDSFEELVAAERVCTIDGPSRLTSRIEHYFIPRMASGHKDWLDRLRLFTDYIESGESYDIVLLGSRYAHAVEVEEKSFVSEATLQLPDRDVGVRYTTKKPSFTMNVRIPDHAVSTAKMGARREICSLRPYYAVHRANAHEM